MVHIPCLLDACLTLKEADPLKHSQPMFDRAASTDLGSKIRRRSDLAADGHPPKDSLITRFSVVDQELYFCAFSFNSLARRSR